MKKGKLIAGVVWLIAGGLIAAALIALMQRLLISGVGFIDDIGNMMIVENPENAAATAEPTIDPETLFPGKYWRSVTIISDDSGLADALSTALFLLPLEEGQKLLDTCGAQAMWVDAEGNQYYTPGFEALIRT